MERARLPLSQVLVLGGLTSFGPLALDLYLPALPALTRDLGTTESLGQATMSLCMVGLAGGQLLFGPLSDRFGRRVPLLAGVGAFAVTSALCALVPSIELLLVLRLLGGLAGACGIVCARAMVRDLYDGATAARMFAMLLVVSGAAPVVAPVLGSQLLRVTDWRGLFWVLAGIGVLLLVAALTRPETLPVERRRAGGLARTAASLRVVAADRTFLGPTLVLALTCTGMFVYIAMGSYVLQDGYGLGAQAYGAVFAVNAVGILVAGQVSAWLVDRHGPRRLLLAGVVVALAGAVGLLVATLLATPVWVLLVPLFLVVAAVGLVLPNGTALALAGQRERAGAASGLLGTAQFAFGAVVPPLVSTGGVTAVAMAVTILVSVLAGAAAVALLRPRAPA
ncbi:multidrug effflux MFS transporter [Pseudonocardia sp. HH130630-07]|uniref:multidrug effflux MFS transporter n=1 Tax=Pseudonocardia sp. HH130630-07 TaxID=1690815 RepID=UPI000814DBDF|nr:multidrug effflux MFS transporter [Pseudonocardia sp. HH130630-07]ANY05392.1 Bcr/CflA subfamily drug resistance transporter [Pseudonocardia sp. HH130630-07]